MPFYVDQNLNYIERGEIMKIALFYDDGGKTEVTVNLPSDLARIAQLCDDGMFSSWRYVR